MNKKIILFGAIGLYLIDVVVALLNIGGEGNSSLINLFLGIFQLAAIFSGLYSVSVLGLRNPIGKAVLFFSLGLVVTFIGSSIFAYYHFTSGDIGFPSFADLFILLGYPLLLLGLFIQMRFVNVLISRSKKIFLSLITLFLAAVIVYFGILLPFDLTAPLMVNFVQTLYGIADLVLVTAFVFVLVLAFEYRGGKFFYPWLFVFLGVLSTLCGDILFAILTNEYFVNASIRSLIDMFWAGAYVFYVYGLLNLGLIVASLQSDILKKIQKENKSTTNTSAIIK